LDFGFSEKEENFRREVREFAEKEIPQRWYELAGICPAWATMVEDSDEKWDMIWQFRRKLAQRGWLALSFPKEYGGGGLGPIYKYILTEELCLLGAPNTGLEDQVNIDMVGPTILRFGTEEQKKKYCGAIARGEMQFCLLYTEPEAGSDLAAVQTKAEEKDDCYIVNGQKIFSSGAHRSHYGFLLARTDPDAPKHKGISYFMLDMKSPGITVLPLINIGNIHHFNQTYFDNVKIPKENLLGEKNKGFYYMIEALAYERGMYWMPGQLKRGLNLFLKYAKESDYGKTLLEAPMNQQVIAKLAIDIEVCRLLALQVISTLEKGKAPVSESPVLFLFGSQLSRDMANMLTELSGLYGQLCRDSKWAFMDGYPALNYLESVSAGVGAGSQEIERNTIATIGLGLPRAY